MKLAASMRLNHPKLPAPNAEYPFTHDIVGGGKGVRQRLAEKGLKNWRFDLAWPTLMVAAEVEGGAYVNGRHVQGQGFANDLVKYGWAAYYGWIVYRCDANMIKTGMAAHQLSKIIKRTIRTLELGEKYGKQRDN